MLKWQKKNWAFCLLMLSSNPFLIFSTQKNTLKKSFLWCFQISIISFYKDIKDLKSGKEFYYILQLWDETQVESLSSYLIFSSFLDPPILSNPIFLSPSSHPTQPFSPSTSHHIQPFLLPPSILSNQNILSSSSHPIQPNPSLSLLPSYLTQSFYLPPPVLSNPSLSNLLFYPTLLSPFSHPIQSHPSLSQRQSYPTQPYFLPPTIPFLYILFFFTTQPYFLYPPFQPNPNLLSSSFPPIKPYSLYPLFLSNPYVISPFYLQSNPTPSVSYQERMYA